MLASSYASYYKFVKKYKTKDIYKEISIDSEILYDANDDLSMLAEAKEATAGTVYEYIDDDGDSLLIIAPEGWN